MEEDYLMGEIYSTILKTLFMSLTDRVMKTKYDLKKIQQLTKNDI